MVLTILTVIGGLIFAGIKVVPAIGLLLTDKAATLDVKCGYVYAGFSFGGALLPMIWGGSPWFGLFS